MRIRRLHQAIGFICSGVKVCCTDHRQLRLSTRAVVARVHTVILATRFSITFPMRRDLAEPFDAGVAQGRVGIEAAGDGVGDERGALFLQQLNQPLLPRNQLINLRRLPIQKLRNRPLLRGSSE